MLYIQSAAAEKKTKIKQKKKNFSDSSGLAGHH